MSFAKKKSTWARVSSTPFKLTAVAARNTNLKSDSKEKQMVGIGSAVWKENDVSNVNDLCLSLIISLIARLWYVDWGI